MLYSFTVPIFGQERKIRVYLPRNYNEVDNRYPVLYMHDGQNVFDDEEAIGGVALELHKYLDQNHLDLIVIGIDQNTFGNERINEYCPWPQGEFSRRLLGAKDENGGKGMEYVDFIVNELKPLIDSKFRTVEHRTYMAGISLGGLISTYAACSYPRIFKKVVAISSAFYRNQEDIEKLLNITALTELEGFYLDCGTNEAGEKDEISGLFLQSNKEISEILRNKGIKTEFNIVAGAEHNYKTFKERVPNFISFIISD